MISRQVALSVNDVAIELDDFVQTFIDHVVTGMLAGLKDTGEIRNVDLLITGGTVTVSVNESNVPINPFVEKIMRQTIAGMVSSLKGVHETSKIVISIER